MDLLSKEDDLNEEQTRRSILVTNIPESCTYKDVIIYFQKERNGGGEVVSAMHPEPRDLSSLVITFEDPEIVDKAISRPHKIGGQDVIVQQYPIKIPEVFDYVQARFNSYFFSSFDVLQKVVGQLKREVGVQVNCSHSDIYITGSLEQIQVCHKQVLEMISNHDKQKSFEQQASAVGTTRQNDLEDYHNRTQEIYESVFETVPIVMQFVYKVSKYKSKLAEIEQEFNVCIRPSENGEKVAIQGSGNCTKEQHEEACETYITLYRKVFDGQMMSKEIKLYPGAGSMCLGAKEAVDEILQHRPVVIQRTDTNMWLFYGKEKHVKAAIKEVCVILNIDHPYKRSSKPLDKPEREPITENTALLPPDIVTDRKDFPENSGVHVKGMPSRGGTLFQEQFVTKKGFQISVCQGDIIEDQVDVIVNYNDQYLKGFASGLPKHIVQKGGRVIEDQCIAKTKKRKEMRPGEIIVTDAGSLPCKAIMHIITSTTKKSKDVLKNMLRDSCLDCIRKTQTRNLTSIAFPAVNSVKIGLSLSNCAIAMVNGLEEYMRTSDPKGMAVKDIRFVLIDSTAFEVFASEVKKRYGDSIKKTSGERRNEQRGKPFNGSHPIESRDITHRDNKSKPEKTEKDVCPICLDDFTNPTTLPKCKHQFCRSCIDSAFKHSKKCPTCGVAYGVQTGNMPQGSMSSRRDRMSLPGHRQYGTIIISYSFPSGVQGPEHPNPGQHYTGTSRTAYLPDSPEGQQVLKLLKRAFDARLTFTIGTSVTTGTTNTVTWNDIHHKTNISGGSTGFGYPDPDYLKRVKEELAAKGIS